MSPESDETAHHYGGFAAAILNPHLPVPDGVGRANGGKPDQAFNVYRNNVVASLADALKSAYPITSQLLGEGLQRALMADYVRANPPKTPVMAHYGGDFPAHLASHEATRGRPFLADVARLEQLSTQSYHSADAPTFDGALLGDIDPRALSAGRFVLHPAVRLLTSKFPIGSIYKLEQAALDGTLGPQGRSAVNMAKGEAILISRPLYSVAVDIISFPQAVFLHACGKGFSFDEAAGRAFEKDPEFDLQAALSLALSTGSLTAFQPPEKTVSMGDAGKE